MTYSLKQAAEAVGKSKQTVLRAIQSGKISARKDVHGEWKIDPAELHRVYEPVPHTRVDDSNITPRDDNVALWEARLADLEEVIADLRERLDRESDERRRLSAQLTGLLMDQRQPKKWWRW